MDKQYVVGLDVGTTSAKAVVFDLSGRIVASGKAACQWTSVSSGAEISAQSLAHSAHSALQRAIEQTPPGQICAIGIASLAESGILLDGANTPVAPAIAWHDKRDAAQLTRLAADIGRDAFSAMTGLPFRQQWSITKHRWLADVHPDVNRTVLRLNVAEWIAFTLGAAPATELSLASRTGWLDVRNRTWWGEALHWSGLAESALPELVSAGTRIGAATGTIVSSRLAGAAITIAGHDHQAAAVGLGATTVGDEVDSCGTAEALVRTVDAIADPDEILALARIGVTVGWHALPGQWCLLAGTEGGLLLGRALSMLGVTDFTAGNLDSDARRCAAPTMRASVNAVGLLGFDGIGDDVSPATVWRSTIELVTSQAAALHNAMSAIVGPHRELIVTGGWSGSSALLDSKRRRLGALTLPDLAEAGARGAAIFAGVAAELWADPRKHSFENHSSAPSTGDDR